MADAASLSNNELDHPEVLSRERLIEILCERSMHMEELLDLEKHDLVQLFYRFVSPLPQRLRQLRRAKRVIPRDRDIQMNASSKEKNSKIIRLKKRRSDDSNSTFSSKMAKTECGNIIKINKKPASLDLVNKEMSSVSIKSPTTGNRTCHDNIASDKDIKPKVVKLNRSTLGLNLNQSVDETIKKNKSTSLNDAGSKATAKEATTPETPTDSKSNVIDGGNNSTKNKFKRVAVTWP